MFGHFSFNKTFEKNTAINYGEENPQKVNVLKECDNSFFSLVSEQNSTFLIKEEDEYYYYVTEEERETLARLVHQEGNNQSEKCQRAIVSVVFNRLDNEHFDEDTLLDIIYAPQQFSVIPLLPNTTPNQTNYDAVDYVLKNGPTVPYYVCFFPFCPLF